MSCNNHPPERFELNADEPLPQYWEAEIDLGRSKLKCQQCGFEREYVVRSRDQDSLVQVWTDYRSPDACPHPGKIGFHSEEQALVGAEEKGSQYDSVMDVYECRCGLWHLTTVVRHRPSSADTNTA